MVTPYQTRLAPHAGEAGAIRPRRRARFEPPPALPIDRVPALSTTATDGSVLPEPGLEVSIELPTLEPGEPTTEPSSPPPALDQMTERLNARATDDEATSLARSRSPDPPREGRPRRQSRASTHPAVLATPDELGAGTPSRAEAPTQHSGGIRVSASARTGTTDTVPSVPSGARATRPAPAPTADPVPTGPSQPTLREKIPTPPSTSVGAAEPDSGSHGRSIRRAREHRPHPQSFEGNSSSETPDRRDLRLAQAIAPAVSDQIATAKLARSEVAARLAPPTAPRFATADVAGPEVTAATPATEPLPARVSRSRSETPAAPRASGEFTPAAGELTVTIGRIEVKVAGPSAAAPTRPASPRGGRRPPSLDEYLRARARELAR